jgi:hypothetical protein
VIHADQAGGGAFGGVLEGDDPAGALGGEAEAVLLGEGVNPDDDAVGGVGEGAAGGVEGLDGGDDGGEIRREGQGAVDGDAEGGDAGEEGGVAGGEASLREAAILGSSCLRVPAAALRGFMKGSSPAASRSALTRSNWGKGK